MKVGAPPDPAAAKLGTTAGKRRAFRCVLSGVPVPYDHIRGEGQAGRMSARLMAIVAEGDRGRVYLQPSQDQEAIAANVSATWKPDMPLPDNPRDFKTPNYGLPNYGDLFTPRQLVALTTFSDLVGEATERVRRDAAAAGLPDDDRPLRDGGAGAAAYAEAVALYMGLGISKLSDAQSSLCRWKTTMDQSIATFGRQAIPMVWDYSEANIFGGMAGDLLVSIKNMMRVIDRLPASTNHTMRIAVVQSHAQSQTLSTDKLVSTDPPYYDNIGYADLSDFFYVWLRRSLRSIFPELFATLAVPKTEELVATPYRHGSRDEAETFFLDGMTRAMERLAEQSHPGFPVTIYYAFKQSERKGDTGTASTGWETFLDAVIRSGFAVTGTWPMRTELGNRMIGMGTNALASSIVLVCRRRPPDAPAATRRECVTALRSELPPALRLLQTGNVAPVDLAQAAIGPGMAVYTRYARSSPPPAGRCRCARRTQSGLRRGAHRARRRPRRRRPLRSRAVRAAVPRGQVTEGIEALRVRVRPGGREMRRHRSRRFPFRRHRGGVRATPTRRAAHASRGPVQERPANCRAAVKACASGRSASSIPPATPASRSFPPPGVRRCARRRGRCVRARPPAR